MFIVSLLLYCGNTMLIKLVISKYHITGTEITYQFSAPLVLVSYLGMRKMTPAGTDFLNVPREMFWVLLGRCITGFLTDVTMFMAFMYTAYSKAFCIHKMAPFLSPFAAKYALNEPIKQADITGIILGFVGMLLVLQPWKQQSTIDLESDLIGAAWAFVGAVLDAWLFVFCRRLSTTFHPSVPLFFYMQVGALCIPWMCMFTNDTSVAKQPIYDAQFYFYVVIIFSVCYVAMFLFSASWKYNTVGTTAVLLFFSIPITYFMDWAIVGRPMTVVEIIGASVIFLTNIAIVSLRMLKYIQ